MRWMAKAVLAGVLLTTSVSGCGRVLAGAVTALPAFLITDQQEIALGDQAAQQVLTQMPLVPSATLQQYVNQIGQKMAAVSDRTNIPYHFYVVQATDPNAFALPGGYIFVTDSLLKLVQNEAQLAEVVGHEVGHVAAKHSVKMIREAALAQGVEVAAVGTDSGITQQIANVIATLVLRGFGRQEELQADQLGVTYGSKAGYDPTQLAVFLQRLDQATGGSGPAWLYPLQTHPPVDQRVQAIEQYISAQHLTGSATDAGSFQAGVGAQP